MNGAAESRRRLRRRRPRRSGAEAPRSAGGSRRPGDTSRTRTRTWAHR